MDAKMKITLELGEHEIGNRFTQVDFKVNFGSIGDIKYENGHV